LKPENVLLNGRRYIDVHSALSSRRRISLAETEALLFHEGRTNLPTLWTLT